MLGIERAATYSAPNLANRSRCSTIIVVTFESRRRARNFRRFPLRAEPTSVTTESTEYPLDVAQAATLATCRSRSGFGQRRRRERRSLSCRVSGDARSEVPNHDEAADPLGRYRQLALPEPPVGRLWMDMLGLGPLSQVHYWSL